MLDLMFWPNWLIALAGFLALGWQDLKTGGWLDERIAMVMAAAGVVLAFSQNSESTFYVIVVTTLVIFLGVLAIAKASKETLLGEGDAYTLAALWVLLPFTPIFLLSLAASGALAFAYARVRGEKLVPYTIFLFGGLLAALGVQYFGLV